MAEELDKETKWVWALVGNIVEEHEYGPDHEIRKGTKHFRPRTKVFLSKYGYDNGIPVIGHPRQGKNYIIVFVKYNQIENFRLQKVFKPEILKIMAKDHDLAGFYDNSEEARMDIIKRLDRLNPEAAKKERMKILRYEIMFGDIENYCNGYFKKHFNIECNWEQNQTRKVGDILNPEQITQFINHINELLNINCIGYEKFSVDKIVLFSYKDFLHEIIRIIDHYPSNFGAGWFNPHELNSKQWNRIKKI